MTAGAAGAGPTAVTGMAGLAERSAAVADRDWGTVFSRMAEDGCATTGALVTPDECARLAALYDQTGLFRSTIDMERYRFGRGEYRYFERPLPDIVEQLRQRRAQSRGIVRILEQGHGLVFTTRERPLPTRRGWARAPMRHGVSEVRSGVRRTLGLVFHDAS